LLTGTEVDVLKANLNFDNDLLAELDVVVASLHVPGNNERRTPSALIRAAQNKFRPHARPPVWQAAARP